MYTLLSIGMGGAFCALYVGMHTKLHIASFVILQDVAIKSVRRGAGKMAQQLRALAACSSRSPEFRSPEFNSQQPHDGSQPSVMESDALFWYV